MSSVISVFKMFVKCFFAVHYENVQYSNTKAIANAMVSPRQQCVYEGP